MRNDDKQRSLNIFSGSVPVCVVFFAKRCYFSTRSAELIKLFNCSMQINMISSGCVIHTGIKTIFEANKREQ